MQNKFKTGLSGNGFYIILFLCIAVVGITGYVTLVKTDKVDENAMIGDWEDIALPVSGDAASGNHDFEAILDNIPAAPPAETSKDEKADNSVPVVAKAKENEEQKKPAEEVKKPAEEPANPIPPLKGKIITGFSKDELIYSKTLSDWRVHNGVDIAADEGTKVVSVMDGTVKDVINDELMGNIVIIENSDGTVATYANLMSGILVKKDAKVKAGTVIGGVGTSAAAESLESPHLHLEIISKSELIDPMTYIPDVEK